MQLYPAKEIVLAIPDIHEPFGHKDYLHFLAEVKSRYKPTVVVNLGDEIDAHALGDYDHDPEGYSPGHELERAVEGLQGLYKLFPKVSVCMSNHTSRPFRKAFKYGLPRSLFKEYREWLKAPPGWTWNDRYGIDGVIYEHGEGFSGRDGAWKSALGNMQSTVIGHLHAFAGITYNNNPAKLIFAMNAGCLIDADAYAFSYGKKIKNKPVLGAGLVAKGVPQFVPMLLDKHKRWVGKL